MAAAFSALQVTDLFDAQAAEAPMLRLVAVLNAQAAQIRELQQNLLCLQVTQQQTFAEVQDLHDTVSPLGGRIGKLEDDVATLQEFQTDAGRQLKTINRELSMKADRQEVQEVESRSKTSLERLGKDLRDELASLQLVRCLQTEQSELHERMEIVDRQLAAKMDKSEATRMDGILVQINSFRPLATQFAAQVSAVHAQQQEIERSVARLDSDRQVHHSELHELRDHIDELQGMFDGVEERHHRAVAPQIMRLDSNVTQLQDTLRELKTASVTSEATVRKLSAKLNSNAGALSTQLQQQYRHFELALAEKAPQLEIKAELKDINRQLATKTSNTEHKTLSSSVETLRVQCDELQHYVELSTRFVGWFARRGEAYEHNLDLVEAQLERLALASHPRDREPFGEHVRFPRSP